MDAEARQTTETFARGFGLREVIDVTGKIDDRLDARSTRLRDDDVSINVKFR